MRYGLNFPWFILCYFHTLPEKGLLQVFFHTEILVILKMWLCSCYSLKMFGLFTARIQMLLNVFFILFKVTRLPVIDSSFSNMSFGSNFRKLS